MTDNQQLNGAETWTEWFPQKNQCEEIKPAKNVIQDSNQFLRKGISKAGTKIKTELSTIIWHRKQTKVFEPQADDHVLNGLASMPLQRLSDYVIQEVKTMEDANINLSRKRSSGLRKAAANFQDFTETFSQFLRAYSGIVDIIQGADAQYGNVASATLSLLFVTVKLKGEAEKSIRASMQEISDRLPDLAVYQRIYPDPALGRMLAESYRDVILFARKVTKYCQGHGSARYIYHIWKPEGFLSMEQSMREGFGRIRLKCDVLLAEKIDRLAKDNQDLREREDARIILDMKGKLGLQNYQPNTLRESLQHYQRLLRHHFDNDRRHKKMDLKRFLETEHGKDWGTPGSKLMLLHGRNASSVGTEHCWLSLVAAELAEKLFESGIPVAYEGCSRSSTLELTMSRLVYQLLERDPSLIRRADDFLEIASQLSQKDMGAGKIDTLRTALLRIINLHSNSQVYIILNRPELSEGSRAQCIETMLALVRDTTAQLKVMMVQRSEIWDANENEKEIYIHGISPDRFQRVSLDQD